MLLLLCIISIIITLQLPCKATGFIHKNVTKESISHRRAASPAVGNQRRKSLTVYTVSEMKSEWSDMFLLKKHLSKVKLSMTYMRVRQGEVTVM